MIKKAEFIKSIVNYKDALTDLESILLLGRSNVGKSSFINAITNRKALARVSSTPGKTITFNYYLVNQICYLVDAPGYGYAKRSFTQKDAFIKMLDNFIRNVNFKYLFLLIDFKVGPTKDDLDMYNYLKQFGHDIIIICTKKDKVKRSEWIKRQKEIMKAFAIDNNDRFYMCSSETKEGISQIAALMVE